MTTLACTKCGAAFEGKEPRRKRPFCSNLWRYARDKRGEKHHGAKLTEAQVRAIRVDPPDTNSSPLTTACIASISVASVHAQSGSTSNEPSRRPRYPSACTPAVALAIWQS
jgi:hypothetical protein